MQLGLVLLVPRPETRSLSVSIPSQVGTTCRWLGALKCPLPHCRSPRLKAPRAIFTCRLTCQATRLPTNVNQELLVLAPSDVKAIEQSPRFESGNIVDA